MRSIARLACCAAITTVMFVPAAAQAPTGGAQAPSGGLMADLIKDVSGVESKINGLAKALPPAAYDWRPGKGVRSTGEVFAHVAADNYFLPAALGTPAPADTGINGKDYKTAEAFEKRPMKREQVLAELEKSFAFLKKSMTSVQDSQLGESVEAFGQKMTRRSLWVSTVTHLHEHLGQLIAYARSNNVTPPWSK